MAKHLQIRAAKGFTLIEVAIAIIVIAVAYAGFQVSKKLISNTENLVSLNQADNNWQATDIDTEESSEENILTVTEDLALWLDAADTDTIVIDTQFNWNDKSPNSFVAVETSSGRYPSSETRTFNGLNVLDFDGNDNLVVSSNIFGNLATGSFTIYAVGQSDNSSPPNNRFFLSHITGSQRIYLYQSTSGILGSGFRDPNITINSTYNISSPAIAMISSQGSTDLLSFAVNGSLIGTNTGSYTSSSGALTIGAQTADVQQFLDGFIGEILIYNAILTEQENSDVLSYLNTKWAIY